MNHRNSTVSRTFPVAREAIRCSACASLIERGERYHRWTGTGDVWTGLATVKECAECCERYGRPIPETSNQKNGGNP